MLPTVCEDLTNLSYYNHNYHNKLRYIDAICWNYIHLSVLLLIWQYHCNEGENWLIPGLSDCLLQVRLLKDILEAWKAEVEKKPPTMSISDAYETLQLPTGVGRWVKWWFILWTSHHCCGLSWQISLLLGEHLQFTFTKSKLESSQGS